MPTKTALKRPILTFSKQAASRKVNVLQQKYEQQKYEQQKDEEAARWKNEGFSWIPKQAESWKNEGVSWIPKESSQLP